MRAKRPPDPMKIQPPLIPVIDVVFDLLIFFLLIPSVCAPSGYLTTNLPESGSPRGSTVQTDVVRIRIEVRDANDTHGAEIRLADGNESLGVYDEKNNDVFRKLHDFLVRRQSEGVSSETPVLIAPTLACRQKYVVKAFDAAVEAGFKRINFAVPYE
jgi:biopolymer transport protein ExbD